MKAFRIKRSEVRREVYVAGPPPKPPSNPRIPLVVIWKVSRPTLYQKSNGFQLEASGRPAAEDFRRYQELIDRVLRLESGFAKS